MGTYLIRRVLQSIVVIFGVTLLSFVALHIAGDPTYLYVSERASNEDVARVRAALGFDRPLTVQYVDYLTQLAHGDMGNSLRQGAPVLGLVLERLPATIELTMFAMVFSVALSIPIGIISALKRGTPLDGGIMLFAMLGQSIPSFWLGIMLILFFGLTLRVMPISGRIPLIEPLLAGNFNGFMTALPNGLYHLIMPGITIGVFSLARDARLVRSAMLEVLAQDYVTTARAKGLRERIVVMRHAFRNALIPIVTILGLEFGFLLSGVVVAETVFTWPGVGRLVFNAITQRDIPMVQGAVVLFSFLFVGLNLFVDVLYAQLDPRIRLS